MKCIIYNNGIKEYYNEEKLLACLKRFISFYAVHISDMSSEVNSNEYIIETVEIISDLVEGTIYTKREFVAFVAHILNDRFNQSIAFEYLLDYGKGC